MTPVTVEYNPVEINHRTYRIGMRITDIPSGTFRPVAEQAQQAQLDELAKLGNYGLEIGRTLLMIGEGRSDKTGREDVEQLTIAADEDSSSVSIIKNCSANWSLIESRFFGTLEREFDTEFRLQYPTGLARELVTS